MALLLSRTHYSLLTAPCSPQALCEEAVRLGLDHLVLHDTNGLYGLYPFAQAARRVGLRALFGAELVHRGRRLSLVAEDERGYRSMCALLSRFHGVAPAAVREPTGFDLARACERHAEGLWFLCGDPRLLPELSVRVPRGRLLVALPPRGAAQLDPAASVPSAALGRKLPDPGVAWPRRMLRQLAADLDLQLCAVRDVWFATPEDHLLHQLFLAVKWNRSLRSLASGRGDPLRDLRGVGVAPADAHLPTREQLRQGHEDAPEAVATAAELLASCQLELGARRAPIFPPVALADGETAEGRLRHLVDRGLRRRYGARDTFEEARARCDQELAVIERMGFSPYFVAVQEIVDLARARDIPFVGRGSAADSLVAHCLGLTDADPLRYGLLFERFLNPGRSDLPDIDLDFCWRRRDELIEAVYEHFGRDHVAMIATYNTFGPRAAYQEAAKVMGVPPEEAARRSKRLPWHGSRGVDLTETVAQTPGFLGEGAGRDRAALPADVERRLVQLAQQLLSAPRHLGVHPGGVVITPEPVALHAPLERAAKGVVVTQYDMHFVEGLGMVKIDLLGNRALSIVHDCV
ncbi:MAG: PHP domain-containing protein, partial [Planctomycetota bacterium]|nr:PHP domain-containing protein [Planctomycetota bacterium]